MFFTILGAWLVLTTVPAAAIACAVCLTGAGDDAITEGFNLSIVFLMATPYLVVGSILGLIVFSRRRTTLRREERGHIEPSAPIAWNPKESER